MRLDEPANKALSICRNFVDFEGVYERLLNEGAMPHAGIDGRLGSAVTFLVAEPQLFVADVAASCEYFMSKLRFEVAFVHGEPPFYAQVKRDGARINLRHVDRPVIDPVLRDRETLLSASITVATSGEITELFVEFQSAGALIHQPLRRETWGAQTFIVKDRDGNLLLFAGPSE